MKRNYFMEWLEKKENKNFWHDPLASEKMDKLISDPKVQNSLSHDKDSLLLYAYIENRIVDDYVSLINFKLRESFKKLTEDEFKNPSGFEGKEKSNIRQKQYFETRQTLEFFFKQELSQENPDAKLNAFRRWINISDALLKKHCYEGFLLVFANVYVLANDQLLAGLPENSRRMYEELATLSSPQKNHAALRHYIDEHRAEHDFFPLIFWYHAIILLNESMNRLQSKFDELKPKENQLNASISRIKTEDDRSSLRATVRERNRVFHELANVSTNLADQRKQRDDIIKEIVAAQKINAHKTTLNLEQTYNQIKARNDQFQIQQARSNPTLITPRNKSEVYGLYHQKLLPYFWSRRKSESRYWEEVLQADHYEKLAK